MTATARTSVRQDHPAIFGLGREAAAIPDEGGLAAMTQPRFEFCGLPMTIGLTLRRRP